jgi:hypothetical protein
MLPGLPVTIREPKTLTGFSQTVLQPAPRVELSKDVDRQPRVRFHHQTIPVGPLTA